MLPASRDAPTTATLHAAACAAASTPFDPRDIRLSEAGQCPRRQTLRALGTPAAPPTARELAIFAAGHWIEDRLLAHWEARYPGQVQKQVEVHTPFGTGHIDGYVEPLRHLVECKTTTAKHRGDLPFASHVDQVTLYLHFWGNARQATAEIAYYLKDTGEVVSVPVAYDPARAQALLRSLAAVQVAITLTRTPLPIPAGYAPTRYPCGWETPDGPGRCPFWTACWGAAAPATADAPAEAPALAETAAAYATLRAQLQAARAHVRTLQDALAPYEAAFAAACDAAGTDTLQAGPYRIRRTAVPGRATIDWDAAVAAGAADPAALAPFTRTTAGYTRWTLTERSAS